jgi:hypothetical protein
MNPDASKFPIFPGNVSVNDALILFSEDLAVAPAVGATCATAFPQSCIGVTVLRQIRVGPTTRIACRSVVMPGTVQVRVTRLPLRAARRSCGGFGKSRDGGCGGLMVAQFVEISIAAAATGSKSAESFMRTATEYQNRWWVGSRWR